jgi:hypothetical protein
MATYFSSGCMTLAAGCFGAAGGIGLLATLSMTSATTGSTADPTHSHSMRVVALIFNETLHSDYQQQYDLLAHQRNPATKNTELLI